MNPPRLSFSDLQDRDRTDEGESLGWTIENNPVWGRMPGVRRSIGTLQKDWLVKKSNALPEEFCIAVRGHKGWSKDPDVTARYALAVSFEILGKEIPIYAPLKAAVLELQAEIETRSKPKSKWTCRNEQSRFNNRDQLGRQHRD